MTNIVFSFEATGFVTESNNRGSNSVLCWTEKCSPEQWVLRKAR